MDLSHHLSFWKKWKSPLLYVREEIHRFLIVGRLVFTYFYKRLSQRIFFFSAIATAAIVAVARRNVLAVSWDTRHAGAFYHVFQSFPRSENKFLSVNAVSGYVFGFSLAFTVQSRTDSAEIS